MMITSFKRTAAVLAALFVLLSIPGAGQEIGAVVSIARAEFEAKGLGRHRLDLLMERDGRVYAAATPREIARLFAEGVAFVSESERFSPIPLPEVTPSGGINGAYHTSRELEADLLALRADHPALARLVAIGESLERRTIYALKISDNPDLAEGETPVLFLGCHHGREWISVEVPFLFGKYILENYETDARIKNLVDRSEIWIVPLVNPDGLDYSVYVYRYWRKNRRANADGSFGVDLNRNYGFQWGYDDVGSSADPAANDFRGTAPFSEPESAAVRDLFLGRSFRAIVSFHSYSQIIIYPWGYVDEPTVKDAELRSVAQAMSLLMETVRGTVYAFGQAAGGLYLTNGDTTDWAFSVSGAPSYTIELPPLDIQGGGFFNSEAEIDLIFRENLPAMLHLAEYAVQHDPAARAAGREEDRRIPPLLRFKGPKKIR